MNLFQIHKLSQKLKFTNKFIIKMMLYELSRLKLIFIFITKKNYITKVNK